MAFRLIGPKFHARDPATGKPLAGGKAYFYKEKTRRLANVWRNENKSVVVNELGRLTDSNASEYGLFGVSVAVSEDSQVLAVGALDWLGSVQPLQGGVYVFDSVGGVWVQRGNVLLASDGKEEEEFGVSIALNADGTIMAVGASGWSGAQGYYQGAVYVYDWNGSSWVERTTALVPSDAAASTGFGLGIALSGDGTVMAVGAYLWDGAAGSNQGAVYVYDWNGSTWVERTTALVASDAGQGAGFGTSVALSIDGTIMAVGAVIEDGSPTVGQGAVYVYDWNGSAWVQRGSVITASGLEPDDRFGRSVALSDDGTIMAVGASKFGNNPGGVYLYDWNGSAWVERTTALVASDAGGSDYFGTSCAISNGAATIIVGSPSWDGAAGLEQGAVYQFEFKTAEQDNPVILDDFGNASVYADHEMDVVLKDVNDRLVWSSRNIADYRKAFIDEWEPAIEVNYLSKNQFTVAGDFTSTFTKFRKLKIEDARQLYASVVSAVYGAPNTTVTIDVKSGSLSRLLETVECSFFKGSPRSLPYHPKYLPVAPYSDGVDHGVINNGSLSPDFSKGFFHKVSVARDFTLNALVANAPDVLPGLIYIKSDGLGTVNFSSAYNVPDPLQKDAGANEFLLQVFTKGGIILDAKLIEQWVSAKIQQLIPSDAGADDRFGHGVSISGDGKVLAVGAPFWDGGAGANQGGVFIFDRVDEGWVQRGGFITASDAGADDYFGRSVALNGDGTILAVGAYGWDGVAGADQGAVYVLDWNGSSWVERTTSLVASDAVAGDWFGSGIALNGDGTIMAVGALRWDGVAGADQGAVYVFDWNGSSWAERTTALVASDAGAGDWFGSGVALNGDGTILVVGAYGWDGVAGANQGAVYVLDWNGSSWVERTTALTASVPKAGDYFGISVALNGDGTILAVGAYGWDGGAGTDQGAVYFLDWNGSSWVQQKFQEGLSSGEDFGSSVGLDSTGSKWAVGAQGWSGPAGAQQGTVYTLFEG